MDETLLLTIPAAASRLSLGRSKTYELIQCGLLPVCRIGRAVRIKASDVQLFVERLQTDQGDESHE